MTDDVVTVEVGPFAPTPLQTTEVLASAIRIHRTRHRTVTSNGIVCGIGPFVRTLNWSVPANPGAGR
jgi:hypothetical protein